MSSCPPFSSKDCNGVCNGPSILDCAGTCYNPTLNPIPQHVRDCAGVCYDHINEDPPNFYDKHGNCVDKLDCPPDPPDEHHCEEREEDDVPPFYQIPCHKRKSHKNLIIFSLLVFLLLFGIVMSRRKRESHEQ